MRQHRSVIFPSMVTIFLCSLLLAASLSSLGGVLRLLDVEKNLYTVEAFLPENVAVDSIASIRNRLNHYRHIDSVAYVSAEEALEDFRNHFSGEMLDLVEGNPLPPYFRIKLDEASQNPADLTELRNALSQEDFFEEVQANVEWVEKIAAWKFRMVFWPICISILLIVTLSLIICNSVRLSLLSRKLLVENMKYAGGSYFFIEFPFVLQGIVQGFVGSCLAVALLYTVMVSISEVLPVVAPYVTGLWIVLVAVVLLVTLLSGYFSFSTVRKFLDIKRNEQD